MWPCSESINQSHSNSCLMLLRICLSLPKVAMWPFSDSGDWKGMNLCFLAALLLCSHTLRHGWYKQTQPCTHSSVLVLGFFFFYLFLSYSLSGILSANTQPTHLSVPLISHRWNSSPAGPTHLFSILSQQSTTPLLPHTPTAWPACSWYRPQHPSATVAILHVVEPLQQGMIRTERVNGHPSR